VSAPAFLSALTALQLCMQRGYVQAGHDRSDGGLLVALVEMCIPGNTGAEVLLEEGWNTKSALQSGGQVNSVCIYVCIHMRM